VPVSRIELAMHAQIVATFEPPVARLRLLGELDLAADSMMMRRFDDIADLKCRTVEVDVGEVTYIDAGLLRLLADEKTLIEHQGGSFVLTRTSLIFALVAQLAGFDTLLPYGLPAHLGPPGGDVRDPAPPVAGLEEQARLLQRASS
jgi:anti-anti-sigma factor